MSDGDNVPVLQELEAQSKPAFHTCDALMLFFQAFGLIVEAGMCVQYR